MDLPYYVMSAIFGLAFIAETALTGKLFVNRENVNIGSVMRWWAITSMALISVLNVLGYMRLHSNYSVGAIDAGNYVQAAFALGSLNLFAWVWVFHISLWSDAQKD